MAANYIAARPINLHNHAYAVGDPVDTTGWDDHYTGVLIRLGWLAVGSSNTAATTSVHYADTPTANTTLQALIDAAATAYQAGDGTFHEIVLPSGVFYGAFNMRPGVVLKGQGWATILRAMPGQTNPILDYATYDAYHTIVSGLRIDGNYLYGRTDGLTQGNCRGISMMSSNGDVWSTVIPGQAAAAGDWGPPMTPYLGKWNNASNILEKVFITNCGGDYALALGTNQRSARVSQVRIEECAGAALLAQCTDAHFDMVDAGACGDGFVITGAANKFTNCKSWYHGVLTGYTGAGDGYRISRALGDVYGGNILESCESQDNNRFGFYIRSGRGNRIRGISGGDSAGAVGLGGLAATVVTSNDIEVMLAKADRTTESVAVTLDVTGGGAVTFNRVLVRPDATGESTTNPLVLSGGASLGTNDVEITQGDGFADINPATGTKNPNMTAETTRYTMSGALTIGAVATTQCWRKTLRIIIVGNNVNAVTWDASYGIAGNSTAAFAGTKTWTFRNTATTSAVPSWQLIGTS